MRPRSIRVDDATWARIRAAAEAAGEDVSTYLRRRATEPEPTGELAALIARLERQTGWARDIVERLTDLAQYARKGEDT